MTSLRGTLEKFDARLHPARLHRAGLLAGAPADPACSRCTLGWFPVSGADSWQALVLPVLTIGFGGVALVARVTRVALMDVRREDFVTLLHAKGLPCGHHPAAPPLSRTPCCPSSPSWRCRIGWILGGAVTVEFVFGRPGPGLAADPRAGAARLPGRPGVPADAGARGDARHAHRRSWRRPRWTRACREARVMTATVPQDASGPRRARTDRHDRPRFSVGARLLVLSLGAALRGASSCSSLLTAMLRALDRAVRLRGPGPDERSTAPPGWPHLLGTDDFGRDVLSRVIFGARTSLSVSATAIAISVAVGMTHGGRRGLLRRRFSSAR